MTKKTKSAAGVPGKYRCVRHPDRYPVVRNPETLDDLCWECLLGTERFGKKFGALAKGFYKQGGPGFAGIE